MTFAFPFSLFASLPYTRTGLCFKHWEGLGQGFCKSGSRTERGRPWGPGCAVDTARRLTVGAQFRVGVTLTPTPSYLGRDRGLGSRQGGQQWPFSVLHCPHPQPHPAPCNPTRTPQAGEGGLRLIVLSVFLRCLEGWRLHLFFFFNAA